MDKQILKRFDDLVVMGEEINANAYNDDGLVYVRSDKFIGWLTSTLSLIGIVFSGKNYYSNVLEDALTNRQSYIGYFRDCLESFKAAREEYAGGYSFNLRSLIGAEFSEDALEQAEELLESGYEVAACVVAGVALEITLKILCDKEEIEHSKLDKMNAELKKADIYNLSMQKQITTWAGRRNDAAHGDGDKNSKNDVKDMITGVRRFIGEYL